MRQIKVLYIIESLGRGGAERVLATTTRFLDRARFNLTVCSLFDTCDFKEELERNGIPVFVLGLQRKGDVKNGILALSDFIKRNRIDIVHTHLFFANIYGRIAARLARVKHVVTTLHNPDYTYEDNGRFSFKLRKFADRYTGRFLNTAFIAVSDAVRRDYIKWMGFNNIEVFYNSVDLEEFKPDPLLDVHKIRGTFGIAKEDFLLLNIGRLHPQKGQVYLIEAMRLLRERCNINFKLLIAGEGSLEGLFLEKIKAYSLQDRVRLIGKIEDVRSLIAGCDLFVFPSVYEALGVALIEAMAMGRPVIASAAEGILEVVANEKEGLLVEPRSSEGLAEAILRLYHQPPLRERLAATARRTVRERFSITDNIHRLENFYIDLLGLS